MINESRKLIVFANDPLREYYEKGELTANYFNPSSFFDEVHFVSLADNEIGEDKIRNTVGRATVRIYPVGKAGLWIFCPFSAGRKRVLKITREIRPDCIRVYNAHIQGFLGAVISHKLGIPLVVSLHTNPEKSIRAFLNPFLDPSRWFFWKLSKYIFEPFVMNRAAKIICSYKFLYDFAAALCKDRDKIGVIYNKIDMRQFAPIDKPDKDNNKIKILCVGRLFKLKNPEHLVRGMPRIDAELTIIGNGPYREKIAQLVTGLNLTDKVSLIASVPNSEIHKYYQEADICVSVNYAGGVSKVVIEAMASGLPVVINRPLWEERPELLGDTAVITDDSSGGFADAINMLIAKPSFRLDLGRRNREKALKISGDIMEQEETRVYKSLINKN